MTSRARPETVVYLCEHNGCVIEEKHKYAMSQAGEHLTDEGEPVYNGQARTYGFWFNALAALFPAVSWPNIVARFLKAKRDPHKLRVFVNTILAEVYDEDEHSVEPDTLQSRAQLFMRPDGSRVEVPGRLRITGYTATRLSPLPGSSSSHGAPGPITMSPAHPCGSRPWVSTRATAPA